MACGVHGPACMVRASGISARARDECTHVLAHRFVHPGALELNQWHLTFVAGIQDGVGGHGVEEVPKRRVALAALVHEDSACRAIARTRARVGACCHLHQLVVLVWRRLGMLESSRLWCFKLSVARAEVLRRSTESPAPHGIRYDVKHRKQRRSTLPLSHRPCRTGTDAVLRAVSASSLLEGAKVTNHWSPSPFCVLKYVYIYIRGTPRTTGRQTDRRCGAQST